MEAEILGFHPAFSSLMGLSETSMLAWHEQLPSAYHTFVCAVLGKGLLSAVAHTWNPSMQEADLGG